MKMNSPYFPSSSCTFFACGVRFDNTQPLPKKVCHRALGAWCGGEKALLSEIDFETWNSPVCYRRPVDRQLERERHHILNLGCGGEREYL